MRVLLVSTSYPISADGSEAAGAFVADFAAELAQKHEICVVAPGDSDTEGDEGGVLVRRFAVPRLPLSLLNPVNPIDWPAITATLNRGLRGVTEMTQRFGADHLFALWALPSGWWCRAGGRQTGVPYSTWALGSDIWTLGRVPVVRGILRRVLRGARHRFADGLQLGQDVERISGMDCSFLPSVRKLPAQPSRSWSESPPYKLAFLGRWHPNKGVDLLLDALGLLSDDDWAKVAEVRVCGGGPLEPQVRAACASLREAGRPVVDGGFLNTNEAVNLYAWADYLIIPSRIESIPLIFSDAIQAQCPLISTTVGDLGRLLDEHAVGIPVRETGVVSLRDGIRVALDTHPVRFMSGFDGAKGVFSVAGSVSSFLESVESVRKG